MVSENCLTIILTNLPLFVKKNLFYILVILLAIETFYSYIVTTIRRKLLEDEGARRLIECELRLKGHEEIIGGDFLGLIDKVYYI